MLIIGTSGRARSLSRFLPASVPRKRRYRLAITWPPEEWTGFVPVIRQHLHEERTRDAAIA
jgi:hypothetical protein